MIVHNGASQRAQIVTSVIRSVIVSRASFVASMTVAFEKDDSLLNLQGIEANWAVVILNST